MEIKKWWTVHCQKNLSATTPPPKREKRGQKRRIHQPKRKGGREKNETPNQQVNMPKHKERGKKRLDKGVYGKNVTHADNERERNGGGP